MEHLKLFFLRQHLLYLRIALNSLYSQGWPWTSDFLASTSGVLGLQVCVVWFVGHWKQKTVLRILGMLSTDRVTISYYIFVMYVLVFCCITQTTVATDGMGDFFVTPWWTFFSWWEFWGPQHLKSTVIIMPVLFLRVTWDNFMTIGMYSLPKP